MLTRSVALLNAPLHNFSDGCTRARTRHALLHDVSYQTGTIAYSDPAGACGETASQVAHHPDPFAETRPARQVRAGRETAQSGRSVR